MATSKQEAHRKTIEAQALLDEVERGKRAAALSTATGDDTYAANVDKARREWTRPEPIDKS